MTLDEFWDHIRATKRKDPDAHQERLVKRLAKLPVDDILDFGNWWWIVRCEAYSWNLWGAAYIINGGCSDDGFDYFRGWLILQGRDVFPELVERHARFLSQMPSSLRPAFALRFFGARGSSFTSSSQQQ